MLPRERVLTTLSHEEPDRIPWGEHSIDYNIYEMVLGRETLVQAKFRQTQAWWDGRRDEIVAHHKRDIIDLAEALEFDIVTVGLMPPADAPPEPMEKVDEKTYRDEDGHLYRISATTHDLCTYRLNKDAFVPPTLESLQAEIDEIDAEGVPRPDESCFEVARHVIDRMKPTHFIATCSGDIGFPGFGLDMEDQLVNMMLHPELNGKLNELAGKRAIGMLKHLAEAGYDGVIPCGDYGSSTGLLGNPTIFREHVLPWLKRHCDEAHRLGLKVLKHSCGRVWEVLDYFVEAGYDAYEALQASAGMDIRLLKQQYGDKLTLWGNVTNENLILGTPQAVLDDARYAIGWGAPGGGYIYGVSHSLAVGVKPENLEAMKWARDHWGTYPIDVPDVPATQPPLA